MGTETRVALITGAASGIGAAIAERLAQDGVTAICTDRDADGAEATAARIRSTGGSGVSLRLDIAEADDIERVRATVEAEWGQLHVLVNNAGIGHDVPIAELDPASLRRVLSINLEGAINLTVALRPLLQHSTTGRVLNISSVQGLRGAKGSLAYGASKGGIINATRGLACDLAEDGILVNALAPGFIDTPLALFADGTSEYDTDWFQSIYVEHGRIPLRRPASAAEVAESAVFFCSPANSYVTGQVLAVDGGLTATF